MVKSLENLINVAVTTPQWWDQIGDSSLLDAHEIAALRLTDEEARKHFITNNQIIYIVEAGKPVAYVTRTEKNRHKQTRTFFETLQKGDFVSVPQDTVKGMREGVRNLPINPADLSLVRVELDKGTKYTSDQRYVYFEADKKDQKDEFRNLSNLVYGYSKKTNEKFIGSKRGRTVFRFLSPDYLREATEIYRNGAVIQAFELNDLTTDGFVGGIGKLSRLPNAYLRGHSLKDPYESQVQNAAGVLARNPAMAAHYLSASAAETLRKVLGAYEAQRQSSKK